MGLAYPTNMSTPVQAENWLKEGRKLCEELELTWKYPKVGKVITLSPDCKGIFQSFKALKVISPAVSEDILLAEAVVAHNSKLRKGVRTTACR